MGVLRSLGGVDFLGVGCLLGVLACLGFARCWGAEDVDLLRFFGSGWGVSTIDSATSKSASPMSWKDSTRALLTSSILCRKR